MHIIGHRGACGHEPENTLRSIQAAITLGADMVEIDVFALPSGEVILFHDDRLDRTTNASGPTLAMDFATLRQLDAGKGERIPTLQEAIELVNKRVPLIIEIKNPGSAKLVAAILQSYLQRGWQTDHFIISSFNHPELYTFKQILPDVASASLIYSIPLDYSAYCEPLQASICAPATDIITQAFVDDAHKRGILLYSWVWQPVYEEETRRLYELGVDGIYTDFPDQTRNIIAAYA